MFSISIEQLCKTYTPKGKSNKSTKALDNINLQIRPGEFFGLLGQNGAGKTSLISILSGLSFPTSGNVKIYGHDVIRDYRKARNLVGTVPQELVYDPFFTVRETLFIQSGYFGIKSNDLWIEELLENLSLSDKADHDMRSLSGGMKRRVLIAQALVHRPPLIILDEPTAGVDIELRHTLWKFISRLNKEGHTILLTTHYIEEAEDMCNRIAVLKSGNLIALDETKNIMSRFGGKDLEEAFVKIIACNELSSFNKEI